MSKKKDAPYSKEYQAYKDAMNHYMLFCERSRLEIRVKRLLTARNKWRKRARVAEAQLNEIDDAEVDRTRAELTKAVVATSKG